MEQANWRTVQTSFATFHVLPERDVIEHKNRFTCICNPKVEGYPLDGGRVQWNVIHNSFDEYLDQSEVEPYKGL